MSSHEKVYTINDVREAIQEGDIISLCNVLQTSNIDLNVHYNKSRGSTPLTQALNKCNDHRRSSDYLMVKILLKFGADPNMGDNINHLAPLLEFENHKKIFILLLEYGAIIPKTQPNTVSYLRTAFIDKDHELAIALLKAGADKDEIYITQSTLFEREYRKNVDKFFEECYLCDNILNCSRIKGARNRM